MGQRLVSRALVVQFSKMVDAMPVCGFKVGEMYLDHTLATSLLLLAPLVWKYLEILEAVKLNPFTVNPFDFPSLNWI